MGVSLSNCVKNLRCSRRLSIQTAEEVSRELTVVGHGAVLDFCGLCPGEVAS